MMSFLRLAKKEHLLPKKIKFFIMFIEPKISGNICVSLDNIPELLKCADIIFSLSEIDNFPKHYNEFWSKYVVD